ncbi:MAG TPA: hypothetical protein VGR03_01690 [Candidatus Acidoferrum sp.]|nr:hypothetical protein [Candidatus Acidoferrum sp.]
MFFSGPKSAVCAFLVLASLAPSASTGQTKREKSVWNYDGGVFFATDGSLPNGVCFRVSGGMNSPEFFLNLKRIDGERGVIFRRGTETVTHFPGDLLVSFDIHDQPCTPGLREIEARTYMTQEMMRSLHLSFYWKRGVDLRPVKNITNVRASVEPIVPYAANLASELPERFDWSYQLAVPSEGVPLTDSLVLVFRTPGGRIAARVAARL